MLRSIHSYLPWRAVRSAKDLGDRHGGKIVTTRRFGFVSHKTFESSKASCPNNPKHQSTYIAFDVP